MKVLGRDIGVRFVSQEELNRVGEDTDLQGLYHGNTIYLRQDLTEEECKRVFLHELIHAVLGISGVAQVLENGAEEAICVSLENLVDVFREQEAKQYLI